MKNTIDDEFFGGIWWILRDGTWRSANAGESAREIQRLRAEKADLTKEIGNSEAAIQSQQKAPDFSGLCGLAATMRERGRHSRVSDDFAERLERELKKMGVKRP